MMKQITKLLDDFPISSVVVYYVFLTMLAFTFISPVSAETPAANYVKEWKCPYCYHHWKYGERCKNVECPSTQWD